MEINEISERKQRYYEDMVRIESKIHILSDGVTVSHSEFRCNS